MSFTCGHEVLRRFSEVVHSLITYMVAGNGDLSAFHVLSAPCHADSVPNLRTCEPCVALWPRAFPLYCTTNSPWLAVSPRNFHVCMRSQTRGMPPPSELMLSPWRRYLIYCQLPLQLPIHSISAVLYMSLYTCITYSYSFILHETKASFI